MRIIAVAGQKGGVGKTTTTLSLAAVASDASNVLVVDVDPQRSATWWAEQAGERLPFDYVADEDPRALARLREVEGAGYDVVFVDTPGSLEGHDVLAAVLDNCDYAILPTEPAALAVAPLVRTVQHAVQPRGVPHRVLLNKVDARSEWEIAEARELLDANGIPVFRVAVRAYAAHRRAPINGLVVTQYGPGRETANAVDDYRRAHQELQAEWLRVADRADAMAGA